MVIAGLGKGENIMTDVLLKICNILKCDIVDITKIKRMESSQTEWR